jgi:hypothetical protein
LGLAASFPNYYETLMAYGLDASLVWQEKQFNFFWKIFFAEK